MPVRGGGVGSAPACEMLILGAFRQGSSFDDGYLFGAKSVLLKAPGRRRVGLHADAEVR